jgi:hypothetical protein
MAGGDGSQKRCTAEGVAATTGPQVSLARCSIKRKARKEAARSKVNSI